MDKTIADIIKIVFGFILGILATPVKDWVYRKDIEFCNFATNLDRTTKERSVVVTKYFNNTNRINCYWYNRREVKILDGVKYQHCVYGEKFLSPSGKGGAKCPFDNRK